jgi:hypothetical protein
LIVTYLRSSSYATHSMCPHKFFLEYNLGIRPPSGKKADKGTIVHKALETLARVKKACQEGKLTYEDEIFGIVNIRDVTPEWATCESYRYYTEGSPHHEWHSSDLEDCIDWTNSAININKGMFDPRNRRIIEAEQRFDFVIDKPWAHYDYELNGERVNGQLGLKGTIDLIVEDEPGLMEIIDWKTGLRKDWAKNTSEKKTYKEIRYDPQLCLYHFAVSHLFPKAQEIFVTIVYINDGGPYTLCFDKSDLEITENIIRTKFNEIRDQKIPPLNISWKCKKFCFFGMTQSDEDKSKTKCEFFREKVRREGLDETMKKFGKPNAFNEYGSGGGRIENKD